MDADFKIMWNKLKKFNMLSTGCLTMDRKIKAMYGDWLSPEDEYRRLLQEIEARPNEVMLRVMLEERLARGIENPKPAEPYYEINHKLIPFMAGPKDNGFVPFDSDTVGMMKLRQVLIWSKPIFDSGCYRITFVKRKNSLCVVCLETGKKIRDLRVSEFEDWLKHYFSNPVELLREFWE